MSKLPQPVNITEQYMYATVMRLEVLIDQFSSLLEHVAKQNGEVVESNVSENVTEDVKPKRSRKKVSE